MKSYILNLIVRKLPNTGMEFLSKKLNAIKSNVCNVLKIKPTCFLVIKKYQKGVIN